MSDSTGLVILGLAGLALFYIINVKFPQAIAPFALKGAIPKPPPAPPAPTVAHHAGELRVTIA